MKGFDAAQHIPPSGEAAVHVTLREVLEASPIPYVRSKERLSEWRREVDFVLGFTPHSSRISPNWSLHPPGKSASNRPCSTSRSTTRRAESRYFQP